MSSSSVFIANGKIQKHQKIHKVKSEQEVCFNNLKVSQPERGPVLVAVAVVVKYKIFSIFCYLCGPPQQTALSTAQQHHRTFTIYFFLCRDEIL